MRLTSLAVRPRAPRALRGDGPAVTETFDAAWQKTIQDLEKENRALVRAVKQLDDAILEEKPVRVRGPF